MPDSRMLSFWFLHWVFRVVELQSLLGPPGFHILGSGIHKTQAYSKGFLLLFHQEEMFLLSGLNYCTVLSSIITVKLQKQLGNNTAFLSVQELYVGLLLFIKSLYIWLCYVLLLSQFCLQQFSKS